ncbi:MAG: hypothetical protein ACYDAD_06895 [Acidimicrobiales bacterium]
MAAGIALLTGAFLGSQPGIPAAHAVGTGSSTGHNGSRTITVTPSNNLVDGQIVRVDWSGVTPNLRNSTIYLEECKAVVLHINSDCALITELNEDPGENGSGSERSFFVMAGNGLIGTPTYPAQFLCDPDHPCVIALRETWTNSDNSYTSAPITIAAPSVSTKVTPAPDSSGWNSSDATLTLTPAAADASVPVTSLTYTVNGGAPTTVSSPSPTTLPFTGEGSNTVTYSVTDKSGISSHTQTTKVQIDKTAPTTTMNAAPGIVTPVGNIVLSPVNLVPGGLGGTITGTATDNLSGISGTEVNFTDTSGHTTHLAATCTSGCGTKSINWSLAVAPLQLLPGNYTITADSTDLALNIGPHTPPQTVTVI